MTNTKSNAQIATAALEQALNSVPKGDVIEVAEILVILSAQFLRGLTSTDYVRGFLEEGIRDLDEPPIMEIICLSDQRVKH